MFSKDKNMNIFIWVVILVILLGIYYYLKKDRQIISHFGTEPPISGRTVRITGNTGFGLNISGVFIYGYDANTNKFPNLIQSIAGASMSSYINENTNAASCLKITTNNYNRTLADANTAPLNFSMIYKEDLNINPVSATRDDQVANNYWQYDLSSDQIITGIEIYPRMSCCSDNRFKNIKIEILDSNNNLVFSALRDFSLTVNGTDPDGKPILIGLPQPNPDLLTTTTTTQSDTTTTQGATTTTQNDTTTTPGATTTTQGATTTSQGATTTTQGATTTSQEATTTTQGATTTSQEATTTIPITEPTPTTTPTLSPSQLMALLNSGLNMETITSSGVGLSSMLRGPATNIVQSNLTGTSNIYSPFLYYNKGSNERFDVSGNDYGRLYQSY